MPVTSGRSGHSLVIEKFEQLIKAKAFWSDTDGIILPYVTVMLVVIIGVSVLALDGGRLMYLQTQLQNAPMRWRSLLRPSSTARQRQSRGH